MSTHQPVVLVVDDEPLNQVVIAEFLGDLDYQLDIAGSGEEAWGKLQANPDRYDAVLLDRMMPGVDGIEVLCRIKQDPRLKLLPVIIQTAAMAPEQIADGLNAGAFYYLTKPFESTVLRSVIATAIRDRAARIDEKEAVENQQQALSLLEDAAFTFRTTAEARRVATFLSNLCPSRQTAHMGLMELMLNAIEHGNLGISYDEKTRLIAEGVLKEEIERRLVLPENADKVATARFRHVGGSLIFTIRDAGQGFDWRPYLEMSMDRMMDNHGRGIAMSRSIAFTHLEYRGPGNCVEATIITRTAPVSDSGVQSGDAEADSLVRCLE